MTVRISRPFPPDLELEVPHDPVVGQQFKLLAARAGPRGRRHAPSSSSEKPPNIRKNAGFPSRRRRRRRNVDSLGGANGRIVEISGSSRRTGGGHGAEIVPCPRAIMAPSERPFPPLLLRGSAAATGAFLRSALASQAAATAPPAGKPAPFSRAAQLKLTHTWTISRTRRPEEERPRHVHGGRLTGLGEAAAKRPLRPELGSGEAAFAA